MPPAAIQKQCYLNWYPVLIKNSSYTFFFFSNTPYFNGTLKKNYVYKNVGKKYYILFIFCSIFGIQSCWEEEHTTPIPVHTELDQKICDYLLFRSNIRGKKMKFLILWKSFPQGPRPVIVESEALRYRGCLPTCFCGVCHQSTQHPLGDSP